MAIWVWFRQCAEEAFVNCNFKVQGECCNPKHQKSGERE